ncbi:MAG: Rieske 2Fe-2S domain-containing protein [Candidatus Kapabacteria bacterium]|nr:Rieske 2Fe-2S domain-containing protein [Candidatus Kapabacteria bacterium]
MDRKEFFQSCGCVLFGGIAISAVTSGCSSSTYTAQHTRNGKLVTVPLSEFVENRNGVFQPRAFVIVKLAGEKYPIGVYQHGDKKYSALLLRCTHRSCELQPLDDYLICPCHGSEFTTRGVVQSPPALVNLESYAVTVENNDVVIHL